MGLQLAVFDMIGTTVVAGDEVPDAFREAFRRVGVSLTDDAIAGIRGRSKQDAIADLVGLHLGGAPDPSGVGAEVYTYFRSILRERYEKGARWVPGAPDAIAHLRAHGVAVVLNTGLDRETADRLLRALAAGGMGLRGTVTGDDVESGRPAPDLIHRAMALTDVADPQAVLAVGDTASDLKAGARAKVRWNVGVLTGAHTRERLQRLPHSAILETVAQIPEWLDRAGAWV